MKRVSTSQEYSRLFDNAALRKARIAVLLATASVPAIALAGVANAQTADGAPVQLAQAASPEAAVPEQVLVTGSLIHGAEAVGVPVESLGQQDFAQTGSVSVSDLLRTVPDITVVPSGTHIAGGASLTHSARINIHNLGFFRTLVLYDGMRFPPTGVYLDGYDPEIIPSIAIDHIDTLADGASATYGSDAVAGVVNIILRRGFDGAITQAQYSIGEHGGNQWQVGQLFGRKWNSGDVTVSFTDEQRAAVWARDLPGQYTYNFTPWGLDNRIPLSASVPATVSTGAASIPAASVNPFGTQGIGCTNCYLTPAGTTGVGLTWSQFTPMTATKNNLVNPWNFAQAQGPEYRTGATLTFDQDIAPDIQLFADGFYSNRQSPLLEPAQNSPWNGGVLAAATIPTTNPYYPAGAPSNLRVSYSTAAIADPDVKGKATSGRYDFGFNITLPYNWLGKIFYAGAQENDRADVVNAFNNNNLLAALGNIVGDPTGKAAPYTIGTSPITLTAAQIAASSSLAAYAPGTAVRVISPSTVPYLNPFCDSGANPAIGGPCMPQALYNFVSGYWTDVAHTTLQQAGVNFDGPVFALPGGDVRAAIGFAYEKDDYNGYHSINMNTISTEFPSNTSQYLYRDFYSAFGQVNIPVVSQTNRMPLIEALNFEVSGRFDHYSDFGTTLNPKFAADWVPLDGLTFRATYGTSFRAPSFGELSPLTGKNVSGTNLTSNQQPTCPNGVVGGTPVPGSAGAILNPSCTAALMYPQLASMNGGAITAYGVTRAASDVLKPEVAYNLSYGVRYTPAANFLSGLDAQATYFQATIHDFLGAPTIPGGDVFTYPAALANGYIYVKNNPADPGNVQFNKILSVYTNSPFAASNVAAAGGTLMALQDAMTRNLYRQFQNGIDGSIQYTWDTGALGFGSIIPGLQVSYLIQQTSQDIAGGSVTDVFNDPSTHTADAPHTHARAQLAWVSDFGLNATVYGNYTSHFFYATESPPNAQIQALFCTGCAGITFQRIPAFSTVDVSLGYNLGDRPASPWLQNINFQIVALNITGREPPFSYKNSTGGGGALAYNGTVFAPFGRTITFGVTKAW